MYFTNLCLIIEILNFLLRGSLLTKDLSEIVKADDFILNSEYLQTLLVVIPKCV